VNNFITKLQNIFPHLHNPSKKAISKAIDSKVITKLSEYEITVHNNFKRWYRQSLINVAITIVLIITGILSYVFTDKTGLLKLTVAVAYVYSYVVFIYRRILNTKSFIHNYTLIVFYTRICIHGLVNYPYGTKVKSIFYDIYLRLYNDKVSYKIQIFHRFTSKLHIIPTNDEVFEIVYKRLIQFVKDIVFRNFIKFLLFVTAFSLLGLFVKNLVLLEMHFSNIFETFIYPFIFVKEFIGKIA